MRLQFIGKTKGKITDVHGFSIKLGQKDIRPAAQLSVVATTSNSILDQFSSRMLAVLFEKAAGSEKMQKQLEGIEVVSERPNLTEEGMKLGTLSWRDEQTGCTMFIDRATGPLKLPNCKADNFKIKCLDGGTVRVAFTLTTGEIDRDTAGDLLLLKDTDILFELTAAQVHERQRDIEGEDDDEPTEEPLTPEKALSQALQQEHEGRPVTVTPPPRKKSPVAKKIAAHAAKQSRRGSKAH